MAYMLLNDNIKICVITTKKIDRFNFHQMTNLSSY
jgi:hypothetical protein